MGLPLKRDKRFNQGYYRIRNPIKYIGKDIPIYRSGIEKEFFSFLDNNTNVIKWSSEPFPIIYFDLVSNKNRKYYVDNYVEIKEGDIIKKYLIEIKDIKETIKPNPKSKKKKSTLIFEQCRYITNNCKWESCNRYCKSNNMEFMLLGYSKKNGFEQVKLFN